MMFLLFGRITTSFGVHLLDGVEQFGGRRVHRLATGDHALHTELGEQLDEPVAAAHRDDRRRDGRQAARRRARVPARLRRRRHRRLPLGVLLVDLLEQIGHPDLARPTVEIERDLDRRADVVRVDVAVPQTVTADDDDRVADRRPTPA